MANGNAKEVVERYFNLWANKKYDESRSALADDLDFKGPFDTFNRADDLVSAVKRLGAIVKEIKIRKTFSEGSDVCIVYDMVTNTPAGTQLIAEWFQVANGKIKMIRVVFDTRPFVALFGQK